MKDSQNIVLYDGLCLFCRRAKKIIETLDWFRQINLVDLYNEQHIKSVELTTLESEDLLREIHLISKSGTIYRGFYACRQIGLLMPLTFVFALFLYIPGVPVLGEVVYRYIAENWK